jgi:pimeloyl-ACP methyl ester carboxylesterase
VRDDGHGYNQGMLARLALAVATLAVALPATAAADSYFAIKGAPAPGPSKYDKVWVQRIGPAAAKHVLVLVPGTQGAAGSLTFAGRDIQAALGARWQVWAESRRGVAFNDLKGFRSGDPDAASAYYFGPKYHQTTTRGAPYVRQWGLKVALNDLHAVVRRARAHGRTVVLGGHSLGAEDAIAYAAWDFKGRAGYKDLSGIVLIDGGQLGAFSARAGRMSLDQAKQWKASIDKGAAFAHTLGTGNPSITPIFSAVAALYARKAPGAPSALASNGLVPANLRPPVPTTNAGFLGNIFDQTYALPSFEGMRARMGEFAAQGDPRPWVDGENMTIARFAAAFSQVRPAYAEWYFPRRLSLDSFGADSMKRDELTNFLGLRLWHTRKINVPLYAYQTDLTGGGVVTGAQNVKNASKIPRLVTVDDAANASHLDPVIAPPETNKFIQTVVPFLQSIR